MKQRIIPFIIPFISILSGCTTDFDPDLSSDPIVVINAIAEAGEPVKASVTRSWQAGSFKPDVQLPTALVKVSLNGNIPVIMKYDIENKIFTSDIIPSEGDLVNITVSDSEYGNAEGSTTVPYKVKIDTWDRNYRLVTDYNCIVPVDNNDIEYLKVLRFDYTITFTDCGAEENFYMLSGKNIECEDPILEENFSALDEIFGKNQNFYLFSDRQINGKTYNLTCHRDYPTLFIPFDEDFVNKVQLYSISKEYYYYQLSILKKYEGFNGSLEEIGLAEPLQIYSNVSSGAGVVGAQSSDLILDDVIDIIKPIFGLKSPSYKY